ncbi:MAG TPA: aldo/keto reductase [Thermomicrobiales bacterium]|jgi:aryl-alcohol dehydrogenase-like predicted oxidoreductase|nr:aldo/keto reductase [Thermomicrobiales bacterium]
MELRNLGNSGLLVSEIGLGGNTFGATVDGDEAVRVIQAALDQGITFVDTADVYSRGHSEELVGQALKGRRDGVVLTTKAGMQFGDGLYEQGTSRRWLTQSVENSLRRLGVDHVDLLQVHRFDDRTPQDETLRALDDLVRAGKVRYIGNSNYTAWQIAEGQGIARQHGLSPWISAQNRWNLIDGLSDPTLLGAADALGFGIIPYTPLASGLLTGKYRGTTSAPEGTRLAKMKSYANRATPENMARVDRLSEWAEARGHTVGELAIAFLLAHRQVGSVIVGARTVEQLPQNLAAAGWRLTPEERDEVAAL